ncbi:hypothetical protein LY78DRAFT_619014 [Colletotrichum sublineola]|nr:hypothetical protein LY78DRAFT_619014 [Colletotrichum sublineola]
MSSTEIVVQAPSLDPIEELRGSLKNLYQNPEFSDLTIESRHAEYRVHKAVVCPRSDYFAAKCREPSSKGTLSLAEDDPQAVGMVIRYFYHLDYPSVSQQRDISLNGYAQANGHSNGQTSSCHDDDFNGSINLVLHANVYLLSKKYGISGLRALAFDKFRAGAESQWNTEEFLHAAEKVYTSCSDSNEDREMKDIIVGIICRHGELMDKVEMQKVIRTLPRDLMYDILLQVRQQGGFAR